MEKKKIWPNNKKFAFTVFDDTDRANLQDCQIIYDYLDKLSFKTTKSVWVGRDKEIKSDAGITCNDESYLIWLKEIQKKGFEIGYHNTTFNSSKRLEINNGLKKFVQLFGHSPRAMANHSNNRENIYWGSDRLSGLRKIIYNIITRFKKNNYYKGQDNSSSHFWGDFCKENITYVRNFVFSDINTLKKCPTMPYKDINKPLVNYWFASSEGNNSKAFINCISNKNQDRLEEEGGACIMYTHFADGFCKNGKLSEEFKKQMLRLSKKDGWFVPVSTLLDFLKEKNKNEFINSYEKANLEWKWLLDKILLGST